MYVYAACAIIHVAIASDAKNAFKSSLGLFVTVLDVDSTSSVLTSANHLDIYTFGMRCRMHCN